MKKTLFSTFQLIAMQGFAQVAKFASRMLLTRILSVSSFGIFSLVFLWSNLLAPIFNLGTEKLITKEVSAELQSDKNDRTLGVTLWGLLMVLAIAGLLLLIVFVLTDQIRSALNLETWHLYAILGIGCFTSMINWQFALLNGLSKPVTGRVAEFLIIPVLMLLFLAYCYFYTSAANLDWVIIGFLIIYGSGMGVAAGLVYYHFFNRISTFRPDFSPQKDWLKFSFSNFLSGASVTYMIKLDFLFVGLLMTAEQTGLYAIPSNIFGTLTFLNLAFNFVMEPKTSKFYKEGKLDRLLPFLRSNMRIQLLLNLFIYGVVYFLGNYILLLFGEAYTEMHMILKITTLAIILQAITSPAPMLLTMTGRVNQRLISTITTIVLAAVLYPVFINYYGLYGAAYVFVFSICLSRLLQVYYVYKTLKINMLRMLF